MDFNELGLGAPLVSGLDGLGVTTPTPLGQRDRAIAAFKAGSVRVLVATAERLRSAPLTK